MQYGLIYHSSFIGRAGPKFKGRISRFLANKCSIASRIDCYAGASFYSDPVIPNPHVLLDKPTPAFGEALRQQVEERLKFFETGEPPAKNADAIRKVLDQLALDDDESDDEDAPTTAVDPALPAAEPSSKKDKKKKRKAEENEDEDVEMEDEAPRKKVKLSKEEKKALKKEEKKRKEAEGGVDDEAKKDRKKKDKKEKKKKSE